MSRARLQSTSCFAAQYLFRRLNPRATVPTLSSAFLLPLATGTPTNGKRNSAMPPLCFVRAHRYAPNSLFTVSCKRESVAVKMWVKLGAVLIEILINKKVVRCNEKRETNYEIVCALFKAALKARKSYVSFRIFWGRN